MPTPVTAARQCLAGEAAAALDEAVAVARRRCHAQTTSLHIVSALLSLPSSSSSLLRDALSRARSAAYSPRLQFKALELCFSVALDRLPSSSSSSSSSSSTAAAAAAQDQKNGSPVAEPPVSNSLMAAIKRSQANQRRNPEAFHLYQQQQQQQQPQSPSFAGVKVELQQLILSILDDPVVSRVFSEAGFRSCDIKFAVLRPPPSSILRFPRAARCPPLFLCNFSASPADDFDAVSNRSFSFPFSRQLLYSDGADENCRRIAEVLSRIKGRNPLLVGAGAADALRDFARALAQQNWAALPLEIAGLRSFCIEKEVAEFVRGGRWDRSRLDSKLEDLGRVLTADDECRTQGPGVLLSVGDLKGFLDESGGGQEPSCSSEQEKGLGYVVSELTRFVGAHGRKLYLIGSSASYETYMKFLAQYPSVDKDWDLQLLPITSVRVGSPGTFSRPNSLMESFVPFGGLFPVTSKVISPSRPHQSSYRCNLCNGKYEQEVAAILKEYSVPVADAQNPSLPPWLREAEPANIESLGTTKATDDGAVMNDKIIYIEKKWNDICQRLHCSSDVLQADPYRTGPEAIPRIVGFPVINKEGVNQTCSNINATQAQSGWENISSITVGLEEPSLMKQNLVTPDSFEPSKEKISPELEPQLSKSEQQRKAADLQPLSVVRLHMGAHDDHTSPSSVASVSTDLVLGTVSPPKDVKPSSRGNTHHTDLSRCFSPTTADAVSRSISMIPVHRSFGLSSDSPVLSTVHSPTSKVAEVRTPSKVTEFGTPTFGKRDFSSSNLPKKFDVRDFKDLYQSLIQKVGRQEEAISAISETITQCKAGHGKRQNSGVKGDIWLSFLGPDRVGKRRIALALAELLFGSKEKLIYVDLGSHETSVDSNRICDWQVSSGYEDNFRGKMVVDHIAAEISKNQWCVMFIENADKADLFVQSSLSQAIKTGRFPNSHRREISIGNTIFILSAREFKHKSFSAHKEDVNFPEERIVAAERWQMKVMVQTTVKLLSPRPNADILASPRSSCSVSINKRKLAGDGKKQSKSSETAKRAHKVLNTSLDLNVPFEETAEDDVDDNNSSDGSNSGSSDSLMDWLEDFSGYVDRQVIFKPFDFDALANEILREINYTFRTTLGSKCQLEIDPKAMEEILAATWLLDSSGALSSWLQQVLSKSFIEARERHNLSNQTVLRLIACEDALMEEHAPGINLPSRILLN